MARARSAFKMRSTLTPQGDQGAAIAQLTAGFRGQQRYQTLLGVTGSGKTFTAAHVIAELRLPTLVIAHNKTLAAQLYDEFRELFPENAVEYFVSYYDYYQPEAYVPSSDTYIDKDSTINDAIDRMRHSATQALFERHDVIIVASVSCIYGLGSAEAYHEQLVFLQAGEPADRDQVMRKLVDIQFERNELDFHRATFRARGDILEIFPANEEARAVRLEFFGDTLDAIHVIDPLRGKIINEIDKIAIYPASHYVASPERREQARKAIADELQARLAELRGKNMLVEAQRLEQRTMFDLEMMQQMGYCNGIENYSRHLTGRAPAQPPPTLMDYFPRNYLTIVDESHQSIPQIGAMYRGDRSRKETLVNFGFRLPSALDNRPLRFEEFEKLTDKVLYVSATPADYELHRSQGVVVEQIIRPTGLVDPPVEVRPATNQVDDLLAEVRAAVALKQRVLITTLTKRMAEDLTEYYAEAGVRVRYMHSDTDTLERIALIHALRLGTFDVMVGINLLREGLDIPEVALVAILDADKEGFLRSERSLIQTIGRAARNVEGRVILYADRRTDSIVAALDETDRRREKQEAHNREHGITPRSVVRALREMAPNLAEADGAEPPLDPLAPAERKRLTLKLRREMLAAAEALDFERAAALRDRLRAVEQQK